jgi:N-methylhydantoinase B
MADPVLLEVFKSAFHSIAEEMGATLRRTAFSPNIKERRDYSCAVFDGEGRTIAMGDHMPVHLGSMPMSVRAAMDELDLEPGDIAILNDPFAGGTHLPDITMVMPVFLGQVASGSLSRPTARRGGLAVEWRVASAEADKRGTSPPKSAIRSPQCAIRPAGRLRPRPQFYVASRAHHADVGGAYPGSMGLCHEIYQEGVRVPPIKIARSGELVADVLRLLLHNVRTPAEREGDLTAQIAACRVGARRLAELVEKYGWPQVRQYMAHLLAYSERMVRAFLSRLPAGEFQAEDFLDDDGAGSGPVRISVKVQTDPRAGTATVDFAGSAPQVRGSVNAVFAITYSAVLYVFRCLVAEDVPATAGLMAPITVLAPAGTVVNARPPAAVAGGNVETSQRIVDALFRALAQAVPHLIPAASSGTMSNLTIGGLDPRAGTPFAYYETIAGGMGGRPGAPGISGIHTHMTNSLNTPVEALEFFYPFRVRRYSYRRGSGGRGRYCGGDGLIREIEMLVPSQITILSDRRKTQPYGLAGGEPGQAGRNQIRRAGGRVERLPGKCNLHAEPGDVLTIETPGGGGWGSGL